MLITELSFNIVILSVLLRFNGMLTPILTDYWQLFLKIMPLKFLSLSQRQKLATTNLPVFKLA